MIDVVFILVVSYLWPLMDQYEYCCCSDRSCVSGLSLCKPGDIFGEIEKWLADQTKYEAVDILRKFEVPCAPVLSMKEIAYDPALRESGTVVEVEQEERGTYLTVGSPIKFSDFAPTITGAPLLGEQTDEVLAELGSDADTIAKIHARHIICVVRASPGSQ